MVCEGWKGSSAIAFRVFVITSVRVGGIQNWSVRFTEETSLGCEPRPLASVACSLLTTLVLYFFTAQQPTVARGLIIDALRSHSDKPQSVRLLWTSDQPDAETCTLQETTITNSW